MKRFLSSGFTFFLFCFIYMSGFSQDFIRVGQVSSYPGAYPYGLAQASNGDLIITGNFPGTVDMDISSEGEALLTARSKWDIYIAKYDEIGTYKWAINIGGHSGDAHQVSDIDLDKDGNVFICGGASSWLDFDPTSGTDSLWTGDNMFYIAKYSPDGDYLWARVIGYADQMASIYAYSLAVDKVDGSVYVSGRFGAELDFDPSAEGSALLQPSRFSDLFLAKYSTDGEYVWAELFTGPDVQSYISPTSLEMDADRNVIMGGYFSGTYDMDASEAVQLMAEHTTEAYSGSDAFLASYDGTGNYRWHLNFGSGYSNYVRNVKIHEGKIYAVGEFMDTVDFDPAGSEFFLHSAEMEVSGYLAVYNQDGSFHKAIGLRGYEGEFNISISEIEDVAFDEKGKCYVIGSLAGTIDCDPSEGTTEISSTGGFSDYDMFVAQYDLDLNFGWAINAGGSKQEKGKHTAVNSRGEVIAHGFFDGHCDFDPSEGEYWVPNNGAHNLFLAWYQAYSTIGLEEKFSDSGNLVQVYPNPVKEFVVIESATELNSIRIYSASGALVMSKTVSGMRYQADLSDLSPALYLLQINSEGKVEYQKFIKVDQ